MSLVDDLYRLIAAGENQQVEFKRRAGNERSIARQLSAFANSGGGSLLIGVDDGGAILGLRSPELAHDEHVVQRVAAEMFDVPLRVERVETEYGPVLIFQVPDRSRVGSSMTAEGKTYARVGDRVVEQSVVLPPRPSLVSPLRLFVAMSFRFEEEPALVDYFEAVKRAATGTGLEIEVLRMDLLEGDFEIMQRTEEEIRRADIVVADFTFNSLNVYYEAGIARALKKETIRCARADTALPFDVRNDKVHFYVNATTLEVTLLPAIIAAAESVRAGRAGAPT